MTQLYINKSKGDMSLSFACYQTIANHIWIACILALSTPTPINWWINESTLLLDDKGKDMLTGSIFKCIYIIVYYVYTHKLMMIRDVY